MDSSFSSKEEIWFLRVCHHISNTVYAWQTYAYTFWWGKPQRRRPRGTSGHTLKDNVKMKDVDYEGLACIHISNIYFSNGNLYVLYFWTHRGTVSNKKNPFPWRYLIDRTVSDLQFSIPSDLQLSIPRRNSYTWFSLGYLVLQITSPRPVETSASLYQSTPYNIPQHLNLLILLTCRIIIVPKIRITKLPIMTFLYFVVIDALLVLPMYIYIYRM
jgi:hypothetical protein